MSTAGGAHDVADTFTPPRVQCLALPLAMASAWIGLEPHDEGRLSGAKVPRGLTKVVVSSLSNAVDVRAVFDDVDVELQDLVLVVAALQFPGDDQLLQLSRERLLPGAAGPLRAALVVGCGADAAGGESGHRFVRFVLWNGGVVERIAHDRGAGTF